MGPAPGVAERVRARWLRVVAVLLAVLAAFGMLSWQALTLSEQHAAAVVEQRRRSARSAVPPSVAAMVEALREAPLPRRNANLSVEAPLFFFHQRKTAGSSIRAAIVAAADSLGLPSYVPCFHGVHCDTYHIGNQTAAIYAGHFYWGEQRELARRAKFQAAGAHWHNPEFNASCLTMFRDPVSRLESCYYFRFIEQRYIRHKHYICLDQLVPAELNHMFTEGRTLYGRSCLNEPFRILSGLVDEVDLTALSTTLANENPLLMAAVGLTLDHLHGCVPMVLERPTESLRLVQHWFPQLAPAFQELRHERKGRMPRCPLSDRTKALLADLAVGERIVYDAAVQRMEALLAALPEEGEEAARAAAGAARAAAGTVRDKG